MEMKKENRLKKNFNNNGRKKQLTNADELIYFTIYLVFLYVTTIVATSTREIGMFYFYNTIERLFNDRLTSNQYGLELAYEDLVTISDWWSFAETTFVEGISQFGANGSTDGNILLGPPRLRQIRVKSEPCKTVIIPQNKLNACFGQYSKSKEDVSSFLNKEHSSQIQANTYGVSGTITNYHGAGYIEMLVLDKEENENILFQLKDASWVDAATRIILIEFVLFNSNVNIFCNAKFLAEISTTGGVITSNQLQALKYFPLWNHEGYFVMSCSIVFFGLIFYYTVEMIASAIANGLTMIYKSIFNILRVLVLLIAYTAVIYIPWHTFTLKLILNKYEQENNQFITLDKICYWNGKFIDLMGICVFIVWILIFKYIKFNNTMTQFSTTLQRCAKDLLGFSIMFAFVFTAFALFGLVVFGSVHSGFCDFSTAVLTLMRTVLGDFDFEKLEAANRYVGRFFFVSFILFVFFILMNMFLAIINDTYSEVKLETTEGRENEFEDYIKSLVRKITNFIFRSDKRKPNRKTDNDGPQVSTISNAPNDIFLEEQELNNFRSIIDKYFEVISVNMDDDFDENSLSARVTLLEDKLAKIITNLNEILDNK